MTLWSKKHNFALGNPRIVQGYKRRKAGVMIENIKKKNST